MLLFLYTLVSLALILAISKKEIKIPFSLIVILALFIRLFVTILFLTSSSDDINSFLNVGQYLMDKNPKYTSDYFPFISYLGILAIYLKNYIHPYIFLKLIFTIFDVAILFPLYFLAKKSKQAALIYTLNPVSIIVMNIHGQMDSIPLFFFLSSLLFFLKNKLLTSVLVLSYGIYTKPWPLLFVVPVIKRSKNKLFFILLILFPLLLTFFHSFYFTTPITEIFKQVRDYRGVFGAWGLSKIVAYLTNYKPVPIVETIMRRVFIVSFLIFSLLRKDKNILKSILMIILYLLAFSPTFLIQWFSCIVPFIIIVRPKWWLTSLILISIFISFGFAWDVYPYLRVNMSFWNSAVTRVGFFAWIFILFMFFQNVFSKASEGEKN